jgi:hypothetical protein
MVACRRADVRELNEQARAVRAAAGELTGAELVLRGGAVLEEHRYAHSLTDPHRPLGDTLLTPAGRALLRRLESARTPDADGVTRSVARRELDAVLAEIRRNDAEQQRRRLLEPQRGAELRPYQPYPHIYHPAPHRGVDRGPSMAP